MSFKAVAWTLLAAMALATVLLLNYWASFQPLSTLAYSGIVLALGGLANLALPFPVSWDPQTSRRSAYSCGRCSVWPLLRCSGRPR